MTPDYVTIRITKSTEPDITGPIDYPTYHDPNELGKWTWTVIVIAILGVVVYVGYRFVKMWRETSHE
jgi:hypothetical protein